MITEGQAPVEGQGPEGEEGNNAYGGYDSVEELVAAQKATKAQVTELESLKGRQGSEIGTLRRDLAEAQGYKKGIEEREARPTTTRAEIQAKLDRDEISEDEALRMRDDLVKSETRVETQKMIDDAKSKSDHERYVDQYLKDHPGYEKTYNSGLLDQDMRAGYTAEHAYDRHEKREIAKELKTTKAELKTKTDKAQASGVQQGVKVEQQKNHAGKVLSGEQSGTFRNVPQGQGSTSRQEQREKGMELINRMRSKAG